MEGYLEKIDSCEIVEKIYNAVNDGAKHFIMENCLNKAGKCLKDTMIIAIEAIVRRIAMCESDVQPIEWPVE